MRVTAVALGLLSVVASSPLRLPYGPETPVQHPLLTPEVTFRDLRDDDLSAITAVFVDAFAPGPLYRYLAPDLAGHEAELKRCMQGKFGQLWAARNRTTTFGKVITVDDEPVSFSIWNIRTNDHQPDSWMFGNAATSLSYHAAGECTTLPGVNMTRAIDYDRQEAALIHRYIDLGYPRHFYLNLLATHPKWDGHGFAARHLHWGKELSRTLPAADIESEAIEAEWPVTLLATPAGWPLYDSESFESVKNVTVHMLDGLGELWYEVMQWRGGARPL